VLQAGTHPGYQRGARTPANLFPSTSTLRLDAQRGRGPGALRTALVTADAASRLGVSKDSLYRNSGRLPFTVRLSEKALRHSAKGIDR